MSEETKSTNQSGNSSIRILPGIIIVLVQWLLRFVIPMFIPGGEVFGIFAGLLGGLAFIIWWLFFSRAHKLDRWMAFALMVVSLYLTSLLIHESISTGGQGMMFVIFSIPVLCLAFILWAVLSRRLKLSYRRISMVITIFIATFGWALFRTDGITGDFKMDLAWRWSKTSEERLLENGFDETSKYFATPAVLSSEAEWPGFRGPKRDGAVSGIRINTDWKSNEPIELWRSPIGPGCSSFAICGELFFTQEQLGENEIVSCYNLKTGQPVWRHEDEARFWDSHAGAGPRSTPTYHDGHIYTLGATGILNKLAAIDGKVIWTRNAVADTNGEHSGWGYTSSPLVIDDLVIVAVIGQLVAYDIETGEPRWFGPFEGDSYSSPHKFEIDDIEQIVLLSATGATSVAPDDGTILWKYTWSGESRIVQPALTPDGKLLVCNTDGSSLRCVSILHEDGDWTFDELWTSTYLKPNFNDFVVYDGFAYGYNGPLLVCIDLKDGQRKWRGNRYGGQILLLEDQGLLVILSERGQVALVKASPDGFDEIAHFNSITGKTWNHPAIANNILLVRNAQEMVGYQLD